MQYGKCMLVTLWVQWRTFKIKTGKYGVTILSVAEEVTPFPSVDFQGEVILQ